MSNPRATIHERWSSQFSFILAACGAAVGLGNIWKFPYIMGENGGGAFILVYLLCVFLLGIPILIAEILIGRRARHSPGYAMRRLSKESNRSRLWEVTGWSTMISGFLILSFYMIITSWALAYVVESARGQFVGADAMRVGAVFERVGTSASSMFIYTLLLVVATAAVVGRGLKQGLERAVTWLMPIMALLLIALAIYACFVGDFSAASAFMFTVDFSQLSPHGVMTALGHAFFTLSLASGVMIMYGAYVPQQTSIMGTAIWIGVADTLIALIAGLAIFPLVFAFGLTPAEGPGLIFQTLPLAFASMSGGLIVAVIFFVMLLLAAFTTAISMIEAITAFLVERFAFKRWQAAFLSSGVLFLLSLLTLYSFAGASWTQLNWVWFGHELPSLFHLIDHLTSNILLPLGGLAIAIFCGWAMHSSATRDELQVSSRIYSLWRLCVRYVAPVAITLVFLQLVGALNI